jgi:SAM-dependent methyltransferase
MTLQVDPSNEGMSAGWNGRDGAHWVRHADIYDRSIVEHHRALLEAAAIGETDHVLDVGCGNGLTTCDAARAATTGWVLGVDISTQMLDEARRRAAEAGLSNIEFVNADAQIHPFDAASYDIAMSRFGVMFFCDPDAAFSNIGRALRADGRLAMVVWQTPAKNAFFGGVTSILLAGRPAPTPQPGAPGPFSLADPDRVRALLTTAGFVDVELAELHVPMRPGSSGDEAYEFVSGATFAQPLLDGLEPEARDRTLDELRRFIDDNTTERGVEFDSAAWIVTATKGC